jgi:predicted membrane protein
MPPDPSLQGGALESVYWGILIVTYPFISGLVAGSFVVASLSHVFRQRRLDRLAPLALIVSFALLLAAPVTVLSDARQPVNAFELFTRPHIPWSPLGDFTVIWLSYVVLMVVETYVAFRYENAVLSTGTGWRARLSRVLALGSTDLSERRRRRDAGLLVALSAVGILLAFLFHGYIGFVFGAVKARAIWSTPLMPVLFIVSAIVSGIAFMYLVYVLTALFYRERPAATMARSMLGWLVAFLALDAFLDIVDLVTSGVSAYTQGPVSNGVSSIFLHGPHAISYLGVQLGIGIVAPILLWTVPKVRRTVTGGALIALCVIVGVYAMRYNVVLGGQMESKVSQSIVDMSIPLTGFDSIQTVIGVFGLAFLLFLFFSWLFPWRQATARVDATPGPETDDAPVGAELPPEDGWVPDSDRQTEVQEGAAR